MNAWFPTTEPVAIPPWHGHARRSTEIAVREIRLDRLGVKAKRKVLSVLASSGFGWARVVANGFRVEAIREEAQLLTPIRPGHDGRNRR